MKKLLEPILSAGLDISVNDNGKLKIRGLSRIKFDEASKIVDYAKQYREEILQALTDYDSVEELPPECPFVTGDGCPEGCRFETRFLVRMIKEGVLPTVNGCPLLNICGLNSKAIHENNVNVNRDVNHG